MANENSKKHQATTETTTKAPGLSSFSWGEDVAVSEAGIIRLFQAPYNRKY